MIALAACLVAAQNFGTVLDLPRAEATYDTVQIVVKLPELGADDRAVVRALAESLLEGTERFDRHELVDLGSASGHPPTCTVLPDHIRVSLTISRNDLTLGAAAAFDLISAASIDADALKAAKDRLETRHRNYWSVAMDPEICPIEDARLEDVRDMASRLFVPDNVWIAVSGPFKAGEGRAAWEQAAADWQTQRVRTLNIDRSPPKFLQSSGSSIGVVTLAGASVKPNDPALTADILALYALGAGKASALFQTVRQAHGWSYSPQAILRPTPDGLRGCVVVPIGGAFSADLPGQMRAALLDAVKNWTDADRAHAVSMATLDFSGVSPWTPFYLGGDSATTDSIEDRAFFEAYWHMKCGARFDQKAFLAKLGDVSLAGLKAAATSLLTDSIASVIKGD